MARRGKSLVVLIVLIAFSVVASADVIAVGKIRSAPERYFNEVVTVEGFVQSYVAARQSTSAFYILKDDYGDVIRILTTSTQPTVNARYRVSGVLGKDPRRNVLFVTESGRTLLTPSGEVPRPQTATPIAPPPPPEQTWLEQHWQGLAILGFLMFMFLVLVVILVWALRSRRDPIEVSENTPTGFPPSASQPAVETGTVKMYAPPPGTLKLLPGRLEFIAGGDGAKEIRFYKKPGDDIPSMTFGRAAKADYNHIQFKPATVSSDHAKMTYVGGGWFLTNHSKTNPTAVNGRELQTGEQVQLNEGDKVEMGEVVLVFHGA